MNKESKYAQFYSELEALISEDDAVISSLSNFCALHEKHFKQHWVGFYLLHENQLILGPFQGPVACTRIRFSQGVCGASYTQMKTIIVPDVHKYTGHIACSGLTNSEIVVPLIKDGKCWALLDVDSLEFDNFDKMDQKYLEEALTLLNY